MNSAFPEQGTAVARLRPAFFLERGLADIRRRIAQLELPTAAYACIAVRETDFLIAIQDGDQTVTVMAKANGEPPEERAHRWLKKYAADNRTKVIAAALIGTGVRPAFGSRLWLEEDIVPVFLGEAFPETEVGVVAALREVCSRFDANNLVRVPVSATGEVGVGTLVTLEDLQETVTEDAWQMLSAQARRFRELGNHLVFVNATPQGGGVAMMRHGIIRLARLLGLDVRWHVVHPNTDVFEITKGKFHNVLQGVVADDVELTERDKRVYTAWCLDNVRRMQDALSRATVIVIDDPQPSGMIPLIRERQPDVKIIYRSHIHLDTDLMGQAHSAAYHAWQFIWGNARAADLFVSHPVSEFIPREVFEKTLTMPATTDPLDGLNKPLDDRAMAYYLKLFQKILLEHNQTPLDFERPTIIQVARFDPAKGIPDVVEAYRLLRKKLEAQPAGSTSAGAGRSSAPQLVIVGHGSIDDPDGIPIYNMTMQLLQADHYAPYRDDIKVVRLHHNDQILNALLRASTVVLQLSYREGFEIKVTEALSKGKPVVAYRTGGIPVQVVDHVSGYLVGTGDCHIVAERLYDLLTDDKLYTQMSQQARAHTSPDFFTVHNVIRWLFLANALIAGDPLPGQGQEVRSVMRDAAR